MSSEVNEETQDQPDSVEEIDELEFVTETPEENVEEGSSEPETPREEIEKWKDMAARSQAELDNFRKRMAREKTEAIVYANRSLLEQLLPIIDNFEMGLKAAQDSEGDASMILQGMAMVRKQLDDFLTDQGVEVIESDGVEFDPNVHEALKQEPNNDVPEGVILYTMRRGYRLRDRILRAANVVVSSGPSEEEGAS
ncbi:MAG: nucleotide exchange factor GrpE [Verrucomicrobiales bacterium]|jgi:molecular chaperone GrpE|nr:nucleotide exchange factor GrpE [Verrucomicrobiales bacterium]